MTQPKATLEEALQSLVTRASSLLKAPRVSIKLLDPSGTQLLTTCRAGQPLHRSEEAFQLGEGLVGWVAKSSQPLLTGDAEQDPRFKPRPNMLQPMGSFLGIPICSGGSCLGVLCVVHQEKNFFSLHHQSLLLALANACARHLEVARLEWISTQDPKRSS